MRMVRRKECGNGCHDSRGRLRLKVSCFRLRGKLKARTEMLYSGRMASNMWGISDAGKYGAAKMATLRYVVESDRLSC